MMSPGEESRRFRFLPGVRPLLLFLAILLLPGVNVLVASGDALQGAYEPAEWESFPVTRFARQVVPGVRWVGVLNDSGVLFYDRLRREWRAPLTPADGLPPGRPLALWREENGLFRYVTASEQVEIEPGTGRVRSAFPRSGPEVERVPLPDNLYSDPAWQYLPDGRLAGPAGEVAAITDSRLDDEGSIWITTMGLGTGRAEERTRRLTMFPHGLWYPEVRALLLDSDRLLAGGYGVMPGLGGLTEWRLTTGEWNWTLAFDTPGLVSDRITAMAHDSTGLWLATDSGLAHRDRRGRWTSRSSAGLPDPRITSLAARGGVLWVGTMNGAAVAAADSQTGLALLGGIRVTDVAAGDGAIWWATETGAWVWQGGWPDGRLDRVEHPGGRLAGRLDAVCTRGDTVWWAGSGGITAGRYSAREWLVLPAAGPFLPGEITDLAVDDANFWVATFRGVWRLIRGTGTWHLYTTREGLLDDRVWQVVPDGEVVWFGTAGGLTRFDWRRRRLQP
jgi:ligand-binding sensor domain-containing protein